MEFSNSVPLILSLLIAAFLGSWHCALMCGPLCLSLTRHGSLAPYHAGRALGYTAVGAVAGGLGQKLLWNQSLWVQTLSVLFLGSGFAWLALELYRQRTPRFAKSLWHQVFRFQSRSRFLLGMMSVFLPCGWLFYFVFAAAATQSPWTGALVLLLLWLSSLPALVGSSWLMRDRLRKSQPGQQKIAAVIITACGFYALLAHYMSHSFF